MPIALARASAPSWERFQLLHATETYRHHAERECGFGLLFDLSRLSRDRSLHKAERLRARDEETAFLALVGDLKSDSVDDDGGTVWA